ncbi:MAG: hypothetical protein GQ574_00065 [Crocinitomix sp.]|nr:hypothetical protein [Crocinitomix sp.]
MTKQTIDDQILKKFDIDETYFTAVISYGSDKEINVTHKEDEGCIEIEYSGSEIELNELIEELFNKLGKSAIKKRVKEIYSHQSTLKQNNNTWENWLKKGLVFESGEGHVSYGGIILECLLSLDKLIVDWGKKMGATELNLPTFLDKKSYKALGIIDEYPQIIYFPTSLQADYDVMSKFQTDGKFENKNLIPPTHCLKTSACSPLYQLLDGKDFQTPQFFSLLGNCHRNERGRTSTFERLSEFKMREIVIVADDQTIDLFFDQYLLLMKTIIEVFNLESSIATANDLFFVSNYQKYSLMQNMSKSKFEVKTKVESSGNWMSFSSINFHKNFFSKKYNINYKGDEAMSCCMGVGLERLTYAIGLYHFEDFKNLASKFEDIRKQLNLNTNA